MHRISIIIPVYNVAPYLRECLNSVVKAAEQVKVRGEGEGEGGGGQWKDSPLVEVICVDDGSTDGSGEILDEYASTFQPSNLSTFQPFNLSTFRVIHQQNAGVSVARQVALEQCTGEWIAAVDPDDWVEPDYFATLLEATTAGDVDMVWGGFTEEREGGAHVDRQKVASDYKTQVLALLDGSLWGGMCMRLINRQFVRRHQLGFPKMRVAACEDTLFVASALAAGARVRHADTVGYHYRIRTDSSVHRKEDLQAFLSLMAIADRLEMTVREDWAAEPLRIWRKERLRSPYLDESIPDDVFFAHNGACKDLWGSHAPFHHKLTYWFAARGWRRSLVKMVALMRKRRTVK